MAKIKYTFLILTVFLISQINVSAQWSLLPSVTEDRLFEVCTFNSSKAIVAGENGLLLITTNGGENWNTILTVNVLDYDDMDQGFATGRAGAIVSTDNGGNLWNPETSLTSERLLDIHFSDATHGYAVGREETILRYAPATSVEEKEEMSASLTILPNPFYKQATLIITNYDGSPYRLQIVDLSGTVVRNMGKQRTGKIILHRNNLANSIYFCILNFDDGRKTSEKLIIN